MLDIGVLVEEG